TTGQSWLQAQIQGSTVQVSANSSIVGIGSYIGTVTVNTVYGPASFTVNLNVGTSGGGSSGLVSNPSSANFTIPYGGGTSNQNFAITHNGLAVTIQSLQVSYNGNGQWLLATPNGSAVTLGINGAALLQGTYTATVTVNTLSGMLTIPVTLTVGSGSSTSGL